MHASWFKTVFLYLDKNTELVRAVDVIMAQAKRIYILMIKVNKLINFFALLYFLKEIENMFSVFLSSYRNTHESLGELEKAVETLTGSLCFHSISCSPKFSLVLLQLDRNMVHVFYFLNKTVCARDHYMSQCYLI